MFSRDRPIAHLARTYRIDLDFVWSVWPSRGRACWAVEEDTEFNLRGRRHVTSRQLSSHCNGSSCADHRQAIHSSDDDDDDENCIQYDTSR